MSDASCYINRYKYKDDFSRARCYMAFGFFALFVYNNDFQIAIYYDGTVLLLL